MKPLTLILLLILILIPLKGFPQRLSENSKAEAELEAELQWLREEAVVMTEIATKTEMDADLVPGMVTVLDAEDLKIRGVRTVYDALSLVPGLNTSLSNLGDEIVSVRGVGGGLFSGNLKLMLDGIPLNESLISGGYAIYDIPVENIDRIEIIRGPGSVIYGEYAYAGVINVKLRKKRSGIYGIFGENNSYGAGGTFACEVRDKEFRMALNLAGWRSDGPDMETGKDRLYESFIGMDLSEFSDAPGPGNGAANDRLANFLMEYKGFSFLWQYVSAGRGDHFGAVHVLPEDKKRIVLTNEHRALVIGQRLDFSDRIRSDIKAGWRGYSLLFDNIRVLPNIPVQIPLPDSSTQNLTPDSGSCNTIFYKEREVFTQSESLWKPGNNHTFLLGIKYSVVKTEDRWVEVNDFPGYENTMFRLPDEYTWVPRGLKRDIFSLYGQHIFNISDRFTLTGGLRYDKYIDKENTTESLTPRLSAVWSLNHHHILKAQYSEAVRPPSFSELYARYNSAAIGNPDLDPERIRTGEIGYIYRNAKMSANLTLFLSKLTDNISYPQYADSMAGTNILYQNAGDILIKGFELEFDRKLTDTLRFDMNLSFAHTEDEETGEHLEGACPWLANAGIRYEPVRDYLIGLQYRYTGKRYRAGDDERDDPDPYHTLNLTAGIRNLFTKGLTLRGGAKNLLDEEIAYPAPVYKDENGDIRYSYPDDLPGGGRELWIEVSYDL